MDVRSWPVTVVEPAFVAVPLGTALSTTGWGSIAWTTRAVPPDASTALRSEAARTVATRLPDRGSRGGWAAGAGAAAAASSPAPGPAACHWPAGAAANHAGVATGPDSGVPVRPGTDSGSGSSGGFGNVMGGSRGTWRIEGSKYTPCE